MMKNPSFSQEARAKAIENVLQFQFSGRARRLWGNLREEGGGWLGRIIFETKDYCTQMLCNIFAHASVLIFHHITLTGSVGNERLSAADVVEGDENHADQVRSNSSLVPNRFL